jgi:hypothetical protein
MTMRLVAFVAVAAADSGFDVAMKHAKWLKDFASVSMIVCLAGTEFFAAELVAALS